MPERDLVLVGGLDEQLAVLGLEDAGVVDADAVRPGERRLLVGIDDAQLERRVAPAHHPEHFPDASALRVLAAVEVREPHRLPQLIHHPQRARGRRVDPLPREVDVQVVQRERDVGEHRDRHRRDRYGGVERPRAPAAETHLQRRAQADPEEHRDRREPAGEPGERTGIRACRASSPLSASPGRASRGRARARSQSRRTRNPRGTSRR